MTKRAAAVIICLAFIIWGVIERVMGQSVTDQVVIALIFGIVAV